MLKIYSKDFITEYGSLDTVVEALVEEERNGLFELSFTILNTDSLFKYIEKENIVVCNANDTLLNQKFRIYDTRKLMNNRIEVFARHISFDLMYDHIENLSFENQSCEYALNQLFRYSNFSQHYRGYSNIVNAQNYSISNSNILSAIGGTKGSIIDTFGNGAEILRDNENIHVLNRRGHDNSVTIEYRRNLTGFELEEDTTDLETRCGGYVKYTDSETSEEIVLTAWVDSPLIGNYAHPYIGPDGPRDYSDKFEDGYIPSIEELKILIEKEFSVNKRDIVKENYKIEFIPLSKCVGYEGLNDKISLCDTVTIKDTRYNVNTQSKVIKTTFNVLKNRYESIELGEPRTSLGDIISSSSNDKVTEEQVKDIVNSTPSTNYPNTLPAVPVLESFVYGFANIELRWTFENKVFYAYEVYASKTKDFVPNTFDLIYQGQASSYMFQAQPNETWYFKVCGINSYNRRTEFSNQVEVVTTKIENLSNYVGEMAIGDALIGTLNLGRGWIGQLNANLLDVKGNFSVTDGNGKRTFDIDSFGNVSLDVTNLKVKSQEVAKKVDVEDLNDYMKGIFKDDVLTESELKELKKTLYSINEDKTKIDNEYNVIFNSLKLLDNDIKNKVSNAKIEYDKSYSSLVNAINTATTETLSQNNLNYIIPKNTLTQYILNKKLKHISVAQNFDIDKNNNNIYVTQIVDASNLGNIYINRLDTNGILLDNMKLTNCGHGVGLAYDIDGYLFVEANIRIDSKDNAYGTKIARIKYSADTTLDINTVPQYDPVSGHVNTFATIDSNNDIICIKSIYNNFNCYTAYKLSNFRDFKYTQMFQFFTEPTTYSFQGFSLLDGYVYVLEGVSTDPSSYIISIYNEEGILLNSTNFIISTPLSYGEPEGIKVIKEGNLLSLYVGFADGIQGDRNFNVFQTNRIKFDYDLIIDSAMNEYNNNLNVLKELLQVSSTSEISTNADGIRIEVSKKVGKDEIVSSINQSAEAIKIKANKIQLEGSVTTGDTDGNYIQVDNANYTIRDSGQPKAFFGFKNMGQSGYDKYVVPKFTMGAYGYASNHNFFTMVSYRGTDNPESSSYAYVDMAYHNLAFDDFSNIKMYDGGNIKLAPIKNLEITTNYKNGVYNGVGENILAEFGSSSSEYYDKYLDVACIRNTQSSNGLILAHRSSNGTSSCFVRVNCDSNGDRFFRPLTSDGNVSLGSGGYPFSTLYTAKSTYSSEGVYVSDISTYSKSKITTNDIIDNIEIYDPVQTFSNIDESNGLIMDVTNIKDTNYVEVDENGNAYMNTGELLKLALFEIKQLKEEIKSMKEGV